MCGASKEDNMKFVITDPAIPSNIYVMFGFIVVLIVVFFILLAISSPEEEEDEP